MATSSPEAMLAPARVRGGKGPGSISSSHVVLTQSVRSEAAWVSVILSEAEKKPGHRGTREGVGGEPLGTPEAP